MASYPGSVKSFTTRNAGDVIQPSHVNDLQDEVNAIEAGLLNGTARLNSSNSTMVSLSVTGGSTLGTVQAGASTAASLVVTGGSTLGTVQAGASTVTSLSVSGGSTLASLDVAGGSTLGGPLVLRMQSTTLSSGNTNNLVIASSAVIVDMTIPSGGSTVTGISGGVQGRRILLHAPVGSGGGCVLLHQNAGSSADCRMELSSLTMTVGSTLGYPVISLTYINSRWRQGW